MGVSEVQVSSETEPKIADLELIRERIKSKEFEFVFAILNTKHNNNLHLH